MSRSGSEYDIMKFVDDDGRTFNIKEKLVEVLQRMCPEYKEDDRMAANKNISETELIEFIYETW